MSNEIHCEAYLECDEEDIGFVTSIIKSYDIEDDEIKTGGSSAISFSTMYFDTDEAKELIEEAGDKVTDFEFDFERYDWGERWRYTKEDGVEGVCEVYKSDFIRSLKKNGYSEDEAAKIADFIV